MAAIGENLQKKFDEAVERIKSGTRAEGLPEATDEDKLKIYGLYKQGTLGDVTGSQPWAVQVVARAKWDAWNALKGKSKEDAMKEYIVEVERQLTGKQVPIEELLAAE
mmetsp:Transcript_67615/g.148292  ORF Transcript_67615/g.148292 Transcript_67615/m.148292 type:complete len:108 (+) Transcript_67615:76-399(+)